MQAELKTDSEKKLSKPIEKVLQQYSQVFTLQKNYPQRERELEHQIILKPRVEPFKLKLYRYPHSHKAEIKKQVVENAHKWDHYAQHQSLCLPYVVS